MIVNSHICPNAANFSQSRAEIFAKLREEDMKEFSIQENDILFEIIGAAIKIHTELGPGLLESVYEAALSDELIHRGYHIKTQVAVPMTLSGRKLDIGFRLDVLVNNLVIIEVKSVEALADVHRKQLLTYLKLSNKKLGLLINFNSYPLKNNIVRIVNKL